MVTVEELQNRLTGLRDKLLTTIADLPDEALSASGAVGDWSVAQVLGIVSAWEAELVTGLAEVQRGKRPARLLNALSQVEKYNAQRAAEQADRSLDDVFHDLQGARIHLEMRLEDLTDRDLNDPRRYRWSKNRPLWQWITQGSVDRERSFIPALQAFADRWLAQQPESVEAPTDPDEIDLKDPHDEQ